MHIQTLLPALILTLLLPQSGWGQRMKSEKENHRYVQLPSEPLPEGIDTYAVLLEQTAKEQYGIEFRGWKSEVKAEWDAFKNQWNAAVAAVEQSSVEDFNQWNFQQLDTLELPAAPQPQEHFFDPEEVQYALQLTGFDVGPDGLEVKVVVDPLNITEEKVTTKKVKVKKGESTVEVNQFQMQVSYVQPVHIRISARGITLKTLDVNERPRKYTSSTFDTDAQARDWWAVQKSTIMAQQTKMPVLDAVRNLRGELEDKHCEIQKSKQTEWHFPKSTGKVNYDDLRAAAFDAKFGTSKLGTDREGGEASLRKAGAAWVRALSEADFDDNKARIDRKVAGYLYLNLIQAAVLLDNFEQAESYLLEMNKVDAKNGPIKEGENWINFLNDQRRRRAANGL